MFEHVRQSTSVPDWWFAAVGIAGLFITAYILNLLIELVRDRRWKSLCIMGSFSVAVYGLMGMALWNIM